MKRYIKLVLEDYKENKNNLFFYNVDIANIKIINQKNVIEFNKFF